jgi:hypothetical protein
LDDVAGIGFNVGNANKYLSRYISKEGEKLNDSKDLLKAIHYLMFEYQRRLECE